jgi:hypothetical protein
MALFTSPNKTASVALQTNSLYVGIVTKVDGSSVWVEMPALSPGFSFGPCAVLAGVTSYQSSEALTTGGSDTFVTSLNQVPQAGQSVLCGFINNSIDEVIVFGSIL